MTLSDELFWRDRNMPEPPIEPQEDAAQEDDQGAFEYCTCTCCTHQDEHCKLRQTHGNSVAMVCADYEEEI